ncbi:MAG TPA: HAD family hydrolase [Candidatus Sulfotelmatobacter sp.]|nr:HAD family hydrolase [Candidatus Sulfotelmatobacter sp.]
MKSEVAVIFDVDGTLVDTNYLHTLAWWRAFRDAGRELPMVRFHHLIGMGSSEIIEELTGSDDEKLSESHTEHYHTLRGELVRLPGARELLHEVARRGARVVLATSAKAEDLKVLRKTLDCDDVIDSVTSSKDVERSKPDPDIFDTSLAKEDIGATRAICVGDTVWDVKAAAAAGLECVGVLTGGIGRAELQDAGAVAVYKDCAHLLEELDASPIGALIASDEQ